MSENKGVPECFEKMVVVIPDHYETNNELKEKVKDREDLIDELTVVIAALGLLEGGELNIPGDLIQEVKEGAVQIEKRIDLDSGNLRFRFRLLR